MKGVWGCGGDGWNGGFAGFEMMGGREELGCMCMYRQDCVGVSEISAVTEGSIGYLEFGRGQYLRTRH